MYALLLRHKVSLVIHPFAISGSHPWKDGAPVRLLQSQEKNLLQDMGSAIDKRIENKIASARRFAVSTIF
jgi:hypothetical protein